MAASEKVHMISTKYFRDINWGHYVIYLQNMKFMWLILWPGGAYTDYTYATTVAIMIPYYDSFHESRLYRLIMAMPNEPKITSYGLKRSQLGLQTNCLFSNLDFSGANLSLNHFFFKSRFFKSVGNVIQQIKKVSPNHK